MSRLSSADLDGSSGRPVRTWFVHRWPAVAGLALAVTTGVGVADAGEVAPVVTASGFVYLGAAALRSRAAAWPAFGIAFVLIGTGRVATGFDPSWWMLGGAAVLAGYGAVTGGLRPSSGLPLQAAALVVLGAVALLAAEVAAEPAALLVAGALLAHACWDVHHHRADRVVARSMSEFCAVLDTVLAVVVLMATS